MSRQSAVQKIGIPYSTLQEPCSPAFLPGPICPLLPYPISNFLLQTHQPFLCLQVLVLSYLSGCLFSRKHKTKTLIVLLKYSRLSKISLGAPYSSTAQASLLQDPILVRSCFFACLSALCSLDTIVIILVDCLLTHCNVV